MFEIFVKVYEYFIFFYATALIFSYLVLAVFSYISITKYKNYNTDIDDEELLSSKLAPGISVIAPAYNEEKTIIINVKSLLTLNYPLFEVIIVNDGSKDKTLDLLIEEFDLVEAPFAYVEKIKTQPYKRTFKSQNPKYEILTVIDKENGGTKADAFNAGLNASVFPYYLNTDVDCILARNTLTKMIKPILNSKVTVIAVGATLRMSNNCEIEEGIITRVRPPKALIPRFQELEYIRSYLLGKMGWELINSVPNVSGGLGMFNKEIAIKAGGYGADSHAEDMDMLTRMAAYMMNNKMEYKIGYIPLSCCWTEGPPNIKILRAQRKRWASGLAQMFYDHRKILFNPSYKRLGLITFPYIFLFEFLAPIIETFGLIFAVFLIITGYVNWNFAPLVFVYSYTFAIMISSLVIIWDQMTFKYYNTTREVLTLFITAFLEPLFYHWMIMLFSIEGYFSYFTSGELAWGTMTRQGFDTAEERKEEKKKNKDNINDGNNPNNNKKENKSSIFENLNKKKETDDFKPFKT
ncbi:MAG: glycosyltransferase [Polaribacter sp.]|jgi:cellulose synthase/poly-beta-1,6-N-acetylglucosamine synthase-like glycosyltransferase|uniref:glycosyltransferase family 2 protein n=1 Tax=Polaribacter sp. TaxID=1920175 RepID=UPI00261FA0DC|nr:glycosyltransferase [Polaribacter sp.]MBT4413753.1 glycosyltransferase family 2 protein [Polaribacter sp.]MDG1194611.1 glycosyltransferase [Polaribacter sp.]MDG1402834.1 glycosyltransferase [Polaribacter sp.]